MPDRSAPRRGSRGGRRARRSRARRPAAARVSASRRTWEAYPRPPAPADAAARRRRGARPDRAGLSWTPAGGPDRPRCCRSSSHPARRPGRGPPGTSRAASGTPAPPDRAPADPRTRPAAAEARIPGSSRSTAWTGTGFAATLDRVRINVLGPVELVAHGVAVRLPPKQRALVAALALAPGKVVPRERLVSAVWDGRPPASAGTKMHSYVSSLRKAIGQPDAPAGPLF